MLFVQLKLFYRESHEFLLFVLHEDVNKSSYRKAYTNYCLFLRLINSITSY